MKKYLVEIKETEIYNIEVETEDESLAIDLAIKILRDYPTSDKINNLCTDSNYEVLCEL